MPQIKNNVNLLHNNYLGGYYLSYKKRVKIMAICNLFGDLKTNTGTFLTFSQYMEDITRQQVEGSNYRVVPSKFIAMVLPDTQSGLNITKYLQNYFENGCAIGKNQSNKNWTPKNSASVFWNALTRIPNLSSKIKYLGDIDIHSFNEYEGIGYSELYCYMPSDITPYTYIISNFQDTNVWENEINREDSPVLEGYPTELVDFGNNDLITYNYSVEYNIIKSEVIDTNSITFNTVLVLYDIFENDSRLYADVPMGLYISNHDITNYVTNDDIYGSGTSYGLKICSRYIATSFNDGIVEVNVDSESEDYANLSRVLSKMSETQTKMDEVLNHTYNCTQNYKDLLAIFKNSRTNVPYLKYVDGKAYWFINGRLTGPASYMDDPVAKYEFKVWWENDNIYNKLSYSTGTDVEYNKLNWSLTKNGVDIIPTTITLNNVAQDVKTHSYQIPVDFGQGNNIVDIVGYTLQATIKGEDQPISQTVYLSLVYPAYIGVATFENSTITADNIKGLNSFLQESRTINYSYENTNLSHLYYAYPSSFGELISITDGREIEYINDFRKSTMLINGINYYVYKDINPANVSNYTIKFR